MNKLEALKKQISALSSEEKAELKKELEVTANPPSGLLKKVFEEIEAQRTLGCVECGSTHVISKGKYKGVRKMQCQDCHKNFSLTINTPLYRVHKKEKWEAYLECMENRMTIRDSAKKVGISLQTAFRWRHKVLSALNQVQSDSFEGIVEVDEMFLAESEKGNKELKRDPHKRGGKKKTDQNVNILTTTDRDGHLMVKYTGKGLLTRKGLDDAMQGKVKPQSTLCSDGYSGYKGLAKRENLVHKPIPSSGPRVLKNKAYHIQTVNGIHQQIRNHLAPFNGVSTKYLQNYMNWFVALKATKDKQQKITSWVTWIALSHFISHALF